MKHLNRNKRMNTMYQKGMTLIELAIVGIFLGLLALFGISQFSGSATDTTKAAGLYEAAGKIADSFTLASQTCGTTTDVTASTLATTPSAAATLSVLLGTAQPADAQKACFGQSGVRPLAGLTKGASGAETVYEFPITLSNPGADLKKVGVSMAGVPEVLVLALYNKYSSVAGAKSATTLPAATADTTDAQIRFTANTAGTRTVTIVRPL
jgi:Tfp pilus assembly protein PilE